MTNSRMPRAAALFLLALPLPAAAQNAPPPIPEVLRVTRYADDSNEGSLRWAIETSNRAPGRYRIEIEPVGNAPFMIKPATLLPPVKGPVQIEGATWRQGSGFVVIDGSGVVVDKGPQTCPGDVAGQYGANVRSTGSPGLAIVDTHGVDVSGLDIRNFCIGVLIRRAADNVIHDNRIVNNRGGGGMQMNADDGKGNATETTMHNSVLRNEFVDNGDGLKITRGPSYNFVAENTFRSTSNNKEPSQGIEILFSDRNEFVDNRFEGYSDGLQINNGNRNFIGHNTFTGNAIGVSLSGRNNVVTGNTIFGNAVGIAVRPHAAGSIARISRNAIYDNGKDIQRCVAGGSCDPNLRRGGIVLGTPGPDHKAYVGARGVGVAVAPESLADICPERAPVCQVKPNFSVSAPTIDSARKSGNGVVVQGHFEASPDGRYTIEVFGNREQNGKEGEAYLGDAVVTSDAGGKGSFTVNIAAVPAGATPRSVTATVTTSAGATSEFSAPAPLAE